MQNAAKEQRQVAWQFGCQSVGYTAQTADLQELRNDPDVAPWLSQVPAQILQQAVKDTDAAFRRFFSGKAGYPRWARKGGSQSFRDPQDVKVQRISRRWGEVKLQGVGWVRVRMHRPPVGSRVCQATWTLEPDGRVFVSVLFEVHTRQPSTLRVLGLDSAVGVDRGVAIAAATSNGELSDRGMWTNGEKQRLVRLERQRERQKTTRRNETRDHKSNRQQTTERRIATLHARARRRRRDFVEQVSCDLAKNHGLIVFENLHVKSMTRSARGTVKNRGVNVRQKAGLNRAILNKGWGALRTRTGVKARRHGHQVIDVPARFTSVTCPKCGQVDDASRASRSMFICTNLECGYAAHADINAAREILRRGIELVSADGTSVAVRPSTNREPKSASADNGAEPSALAGRGSGNKTRATSPQRRHQHSC
jgi:transposase